MTKQTQSIHPASCSCRNCSAPMLGRKVLHRDRRRFHPVAPGLLIGLIFWAGLAGLIWGAFS